MLAEILDFRLFELAGTPITVATLVTSLGILLVTMFISRVLQRATSRALRLRGLTREGSLAGTQRLIHYTVMLIGIGIAFDVVGISLSALFAAGAIFAIGFGFAMQNIAQNFVSGVILLIEQTIKPGDVVDVGGTIVKVEKMGIRATLARTLDDEQLIVPNATLVQSTVKNYTLHDSLYRVRIIVGVVYSSDMKVVHDTLHRVADEAKWRSQKKDLVILMTAFGSSSVDFEVSVWIDDPWQLRRAKSRLHTEIWWALKDAGVTIAFPQLDVHFDPSLTDPVRTLADRATAA